MRKTLPMVVAAVAVLAASECRAQSFGNKSLGLGAGFLGLNGGDREPVNWAFSATLEGELYIDSGFQAYLRIPFMLAHQSCCVTGSAAPLREGLVIGTGGQLGVRYMFLEEAIRPYVGLHMSGLYFARDGATYADGSALTGNFQFGPGVCAGIDFFVAESISLGARGFFDLYIVLNAPVRFAGGGNLVVATYF